MINRKAVLIGVCALLLFHGIFFASCSPGFDVVPNSIQNKDKLPAPIRPSPAYNTSQGLDSINETIHGLETIQRHRVYNGLNASEPLIFFITPTYQRHTQMADLTRLGQTLSHDKGVYWILVEDAPSTTARIRDLLQRTGLPFAHVAKPKRQSKGPNDVVNGRGVLQRNRALDIVASLNYTPGVIYFGDDDNAYDVRLLDQIRQTKRVAASGVFFEGGKSYYGRCIAGSNGMVKKFLASWSGGRKFAIDMASFAFTTTIFQEKQPRFSDAWKPGWLENNFIEQMVDRAEDVEALDQCRKIYAWHVHTTTRMEEARIPRGDPDYRMMVPTV